tara:strand:- start:13 stop:390 length:378 start_codon:yes stop_codon:yes gene_type:complete
MKNLIFYPAIVLLVSVFALSFNSCRKKADSIAKITVRDSQNALVSNATVVLFGTPSEPGNTNIRRDTLSTNSEGVASFDYNEVYQLGQAGVAVLDIVAYKDNLYGEGIIQIEEETENRATVFVQP